MSAPIPLRRDFGASQLRGLAKKTKKGPQARRLLALAAIYDGATRDRHRRDRFTSFLLAHRDIECMMDALQCTVPIPEF